MFIAVVCSLETKAQNESFTLSLSECINYAKDNNPDVKKALIEEKKSEKKINEVIGSGLPQITLSGSLVNNLELPTQLLPGDYFGVPGTMIPVKFGTKYSYTFTGEISQMIFSGSFWVGLSAVKYSNLYYKQNKDLIYEDVEYNVATFYYQTLVAQKQIQLLQLNQVLISKSLADTKLLYENGKAKEVDVDRLSVNLNNIQYKLKKAKEVLEQSYLYLKFYMGMPVTASISLSDSSYFAQNTMLEQKIDNLRFENDESFTYKSRSDYKILQTNFKLQELDYKNQIAKYLPSINAFGSYSYNALRTEFDLFDSKKEWFKYYSVGVRFQFPIFSGGQTLAKIQQSSLSLDGLKEDVKKAENGIDLQVAKAVSKYNNSYENIKANKLNIDLAQKVYDITLLEYSEGVTNATALVDSETKLREAQTNYINSLLEFYVAKLDVEKSRGTLTHYLNSGNNKNN